MRAVSIASSYSRGCRRLAGKRHILEPFPTSRAIDSYTYLLYNTASMTRRMPGLRVLFSLCLIFLLSAAANANKKKPPAGPVNINTANAEELQQVPGIGPATSQKILQMRKSYGAFKSVDDLLAIRGLGQKRLDKMRTYLTVGRVSLAKTHAPTSKPAAASGPPSEKPQEKPYEGFLTPFRMTPLIRGLGGWAWGNRRGGGLDPRW